MPPMASRRAAIASSRCDRDAQGDATDGAAAADEDGEGNREQHADGSDKRVSDFFVPLDGEGRHVEAGAFAGRKCNGEDRASSSGKPEITSRLK